MDPYGLLFYLAVEIPGQVEAFAWNRGVEATLVRAPGAHNQPSCAQQLAGRTMLVAYAAGDRRLIDAERLRAFAASHLRRQRADASSS